MSLAYHFELCEIAISAEALGHRPVRALIGGTQRSQAGLRFILVRSAWVPVRRNPALRLLARHRAGLFSRIAWSDAPHLRWHNARARLPPGGMTRSARNCPPRFTARRIEPVRVCQNRQHAEYRRDSFPSSALRAIKRTSRLVRPQGCAARRASGSRPRERMGLTSPCNHHL